MYLKDFIDEISILLNSENKELIEVDLMLHKIVSELSQNNFLFENLLLKGGTCLIKNYLGYYRFSEDLDFTWKDQNIIKNKSGKQLRRDLSELINKVAETFEIICAKINLDFVADKRNKHYFEFGGSNKMVTFYLYFNLETQDNMERSIQIQINFAECLKFESKIGKLKSVLPRNSELNLNFPTKYKEYSKEITFPMYSIKEILCEKVRAIITRRVVEGVNIKGRDFFDIYFILKEYKFKIEELKNQIIEKTLFAINQYDKYRENLRERMELINSDVPLTWNWEHEKSLLLKKLDEDNFSKFLAEFNIFLERIIEEIYEKIA